MNLRMKKFIGKVLSLFTACTFYRERKEPAPPKPEMPETKSTRSIGTQTTDTADIISCTPDISSSTSAISCTQNINTVTLETPEISCIPIYDVPLSSPGYSGTSRCVFNFEHPKLAEEPEDFDLKICQKKVSLSHCSYTSGILVGMVIVANTSCPQKVTIRYTPDEWVSYQDMTASYIGRENESADRFVFDIEIEKKAKLHFAICYNINSTEYWDNNNGNNYSLVAE